MVLQPVIISAQQIDETSIKKLERGEAKIETGKVQVTFVDTVSPAFVEDSFNKLGFIILSSNFQQIVLVIENNPDPKQVQDLEENQWVDFVLSESEGISDQGMKVLAKKDSVNHAKVNTVLAQLNHRSTYKYLLVGLKYAATEETVKEIQKKYPGLDFKMMSPSVRSAIVKTEEGKEAAMIEALEKLPFVKNTAYIGSLE
jgi:hypothetical protein